jgi:formamidopyrimidine-DNA glycosylase
MPELPEVETIRLGLQKYLVGHTILLVDVRLSKMFHGDPEKVAGAKVTGVRRFGKGLVIDLDNGYSIAAHVKMTGQFIYVGKDAQSAHISEEKVGKLPGQFTHVIFHLDKNAILYFNDMRQFGWITVVETDNVSELPFFKELGPEPFKDLTLEKFREIVSGAKTPIKLLLMDQKKISGIGNIYANDALYIAGIHPKRPASSLTANEQSKLLSAIETVMKKGLEVGGASEWHYVNALGEVGRYQDFFQVYGKNGKPCKKCGTIIEKVTLGGRGTFFCSTCQKIA